MLGATEECMFRSGGEDRVDRDLHVAGGPILEADRAGEAADQLAMNLALGGARADRSPGDQVDEKLRRDDVEKLRAGGKTHLGKIQQQMARQAQAVVNLVGLVEVRVV